MENRKISHRTDWYTITTWNAPDSDDGITSLLPRQWAAEFTGYTPGSLGVPRL
ncbi:hypothetical protein PO073_22155 [Bacteroides thetaiotaomicron]|uniref:hypothetical protein n=1 Tax=Bacteroides TaxID=816 RepID=UPI0015F2F9B4|nr:MULTISPECIES: hypothetical protein [Bacteroides]MDC2174876.1 hypothetical protein [Bacteroides thetaiotaomicron]MDC2190338.1 hypothetical protein [Bacteroides thetaiotaomicron]